MRKIGPKFSQIVSVRLKGVDSHPKKIGQPDHFSQFFLTASLILLTKSCGKERSILEKTPVDVGRMRKCKVLPDVLRLTQAREVHRLDHPGGGNCELDGKSFPIYRWRQIKGRAVAASWNRWTHCSSLLYYCLCPIVCCQGSQRLYLASVQGGFLSTSEDAVSSLRHSLPREHLSTQRRVWRESERALISMR